MFFKFTECEEKGALAFNCLQLPGLESFVFVLAHFSYICGEAMNNIEHPYICFTIGQISITYGTHYTCCHWTLARYTQALMLALDHTRYKTIIISCTLLYPLFYFYSSLI